ncbi:transporter substrate-binding domain-containing protein [Brevibacterium sp. p3-SID960]|uniref:transporter substrate-binding domain-containing protein n=1 Tax=Brevibacterium sp. p3-SID960 TaxID=2916063 RepID=UPI0021A7D21C|nr:transporter substrate-binding domain-containing protein [Brevibacterium sp. p3-SID960]MCT1690285.1 transporter substrate-binding domain-containing protein [Brevibacterium sp. p3-SID960]
MPTSDTGARCRLSTAAALAGIALLAAGCGITDEADSSAEPAHDYTVDSNAAVKDSPIWTDASDAAMLRIGVPFDQPGLGYLSAGKTVPAGFHAEIGSLIAGRLGFASHQITWVDASADTASLLAGEEPAADLLIDTDGQPIEGLDPAPGPAAAASATEATESAGEAGETAEGTAIGDTGTGDSATGAHAIPADLAGPYHLGGQGLLSPAASDLQEFSELTGQQVCALPDSTGKQAIEDQTTAAVVERESLTDCAAALTAGDVDAVVGPDLDLQALAAQDPQALTLSEDRLRPAGYWIRMRTEDPALAEAIAEGIAAAADDGEWAHAVEAAFGSDVEMTPPPRP